MLNWERLLLSGTTGVALLVACAGVALLAAGLGYRRLATALAATVGAAAIVAVVAWFAGALIGLALAGRGEGAGVAALVFAFVVAGAAALSTVAAGAAWIVRKRQSYFIRGARNVAALAAGAAAFLTAGGLAGMQVIRVTPTLMSDERLATQSGVPSGPARAEARAELLARGQAAVPSVIAALHTVDLREARTFESGMNGAILYQIEVLGELGGPEAIAELRTWLASDYAPDIRAAAGGALGEAGDAESAQAIAQLLELRSYEWRKYHFQLLRALTLLKAKAELPHVQSALEFAPDEEGTSFQIGLLGEGVAALVAFDTPEAWQAVADVANAGSAARKETVERILRDMNKSLPAPPAP